jgi:hypothetical protein
MKNWIPIGASPWLFSWAPLSAWRGEEMGWRGATVGMNFDMRFIGFFRTRRGLLFDTRTYASSCASIRALADVWRNGSCAPCVAEQRIKSWRKSNGNISAS